MRSLGLYRWKSLTVGHHLAIFGVYQFSESRDIAYLLCHEISQEHVMEGSYDIIRRNSSLKITNQQSLSVTGILWYWRYDVFNLTGDLARPRYFRAIT